MWMYVCTFAGGSFQGSLTLGKEYTINTYEGHVFFFTEGDDKTKEYARFIMNKDQVRLTNGDLWAATANVYDTAK